MTYDQTHSCQMFDCKIDWNQFKIDLKASGEQGNFEAYCQGCSPLEVLFYASYNNYCDYIKLMFQLAWLGEKRFSKIKR